MVGNAYCHPFAGFSLRTLSDQNGEDEDVPLVEFMYLAFTRMAGERYRGRLRSLLLCLCDVFRALINLILC